jgi:hypothetical protein
VETNVLINALVQQFVAYVTPSIVEAVKAQLPAAEVDVRKIAEQFTCADLVEHINFDEIVSAREVARELNMIDVAREIDLNDLSRELDVSASDIAENLDVSDVASSIDLEELAEQIDLDDLAKALLRRVAREAQS